MSGLEENGSIGTILRCTFKPAWHLKHFRKLLTINLNKLLPFCEDFLNIIEDSHPHRRMHLTQLGINSLSENFTCFWVHTETDQRARLFISICIFENNGPSLNGMKDLSCMEA